MGLGDDDVMICWLVRFSSPLCDEDDDDTIERNSDRERTTPQRVGEVGGVSTVARPLFLVCCPPCSDDDDDDDDARREDGQVCVADDDEGWR